MNRLRVNAVEQRFAFRSRRSCLPRLAGLSCLDLLEGVELGECRRAAGKCAGCRD
jgi:hypothetical protein